MNNEDLKMKKEYIEPQINNLEIQDEALMAISGDGRITGQVDGNDQISFGDVDEEGNKDPEAKKGIFFSVWEDDNPNLIYDVWKED